MDAKVAQQIVQAAHDAGWEATLYDDYSGRGMYGQTTTGIVVPDVMTFAAAVGLACQWTERLDEAEAIVEAVKAASQDSMGRDIIIY